MAARSMDHTQWLAKLVAFDTTSRNSNLELIHYCKDYLEGLGVKCTLLHNAERNKANLWATLPGDGGVTKGGIILSGHTDVVPVDGQKWDSDPFTLTERDGKLYGRGTSDMKGFVAVCMSLAPELLKMKRAKPIHFAWSYDEEVSCLGGMELRSLRGTTTQGGRLHHWGADRHDCGDCSQGHLPLLGSCAGQGGAFVARADG
ncbi:putative glutamamyl carboxypeptidase [Trypanosoma cruzi]|uniref:Putative glutamamyl carboxypeptidase n=1 Tax=Trypanosoma cruzi TaxID=5693 RepID=A0A2V2UW15_TRYCR|nr:putative glutamamyl carboxypeptidase [Trypanosoma cruzi]